MRPLPEGKMKYGMSALWKISICTSKYFNGTNCYRKTLNTARYDLRILNML
jgi:hypothetical protein